MTGRRFTRILEPARHIPDAGPTGEAGEKLGRYGQGTRGTRTEGFGKVTTNPKGDTVDFATYREAFTQGQSDGLYGRPPESTAPAYTKGYDADQALYLKLGQEGETPEEWPS